jgi:hypothetical protein
MRRLVFETLPAFDRLQRRWKKLDWTDLDEVLDLWRSCVTKNRSLLNKENVAGRAARRYERMGWLERVSLLDAHLNRIASPWAWVLRATAGEYCRAQGWDVASWLGNRHKPPLWSLNAAGIGIDQGTLLHYAVQKNQSWLVKQLLELGASPCVSDNKGDCPLARAARLGYADCVAALLFKGAPVDGAGAEWWTPLEHALIDCQLDAALALIRAGGTARLLTDLAGDSWLRRGAVACGDHVAMAVLDRLRLERAMPPAPKQAPAGRRL